MKKFTITTFILITLLFVVVSPFALAGESRDLAITEHTSYNLDLDNDGINDTVINLNYQREPFPSFNMQIITRDETYEQITYNARPETLAVTALTEPGKNEILFSWRTAGSGRYLSYVLLGCTPRGFRELLQVDDLNHGNLEVKEGSLIQTSAMYMPATPNCSPVGVESVSRQWRDGKFHAETCIESLGSAYQKASPGTLSLIPEETEQLINQKALEMNVPPVIIKAIAMVESGGRHYNSDGTVKTGYAGEIGLMQVYPDPLIFTADEIERLKDIEFNIETGIKVLISKKMYGGYVIPVFTEPEQPGLLNMDDNILETWYFALWAYNGWSNKNNPGHAGTGNTYQDKVINHIRQYGYTMNTQEASLFSDAMPAAGQNYPLPGKHSGDLQALDSGKTAVVQNVQLNMREQSAVFFGQGREPVDVLEVLQPGSSVFIIEGPSTNTLSRWYRIRPWGSSYTGWAAGEYMYNSQRLLTSPYMVPVDTKVMAPKTTTNPTKDWLIQFNRPLDAGTATSRHIKIYNYEGEPVSSTVVAGNGGKLVRAIPNQPYKPSAYYYLYISDKVSSYQGTTLQKPVLMKFNLDI